MAPRPTSARQKAKVVILEGDEIRITLPAQNDISNELIKAHQEGITLTKEQVYGVVRKHGTVLDYERCELCDVVPAVGFHLT